MSYLSSVIKSINIYNGTVSCAASFSGDKSITITSVNTAKSILLPLKTSNPTAANANVLALATSDNGNLVFDFVDFSGSTTVRLRNVLNSDGSNSHNILYAFMVVEFK